MNDSDQQTKETKKNNKKRRFYKSSPINSSSKDKQKKIGKSLVLKKQSSKKTELVKAGVKSNKFKNINIFKIISWVRLEYFIIFFLFVNLCLIAFISYNFSKINENRLSEFRINGIRINSYPYLKMDPGLNISAKSAIVFEKDSRVVVFRKNENFHFAPASTTKIMTATVALENYSLDSIFEANGVKKVEGSKMKLSEGERIKVRNLLYGLMLPSGNDAAYVLAENFPGGLDSFVSEMNEKASELKLSNTKFLDPSGYDDGNYTTAFDLARLASYALDNKFFSEIVNTKSKTVYDDSFKISHKLENLNELLNEDGVTGVKTGFTDEAGGVLVTSFKYKNKTYVVVVLKSEDRFSDTREIIADVIKNIELVNYR